MKPLELEWKTVDKNGDTTSYYFSISRMELVSFVIAFGVLAWIIWAVMK